MFDAPTYLVQVGFQGKGRVIEGLEQGYADGGILSPADYKYRSNKDLSEKIRNLSGTVLFDPQFYIPRTDRQDLETYTYFDARGGDDFSTGMFSRSDEREELARDVIAVQDDFEVDAYISPARYIRNFTSADIDRWLDLTESFITVANEEGRDIPVFASLPVDGYELKSETRRNSLLNRVTKIDADGFYVSVCYNDYDERLPLKGQENVYSYLKLMSTLRMNRYDVISGHTHQITHLLLGLGINAFASGHNQNLRAFEVDRWEPSDEDQFGRRVVRYYSESLLDSIRVDAGLEEIDQEGLVPKVRSSSPYDDDLFDSSTTPANAGWKFSDESWEHYLWSCGQIRDQYKGKDISKRLQRPVRTIKAAQHIYDDVIDEVDELDSVENQIYEDWLTAYSDVRDELNEKRLRLVN
jgi:hypothetical protein